MSEIAVPAPPVVRRLVLAVTRAPMIFYASLLHLSWAVTLLLSPSPLGVTAISGLGRLFGDGDARLLAVAYAAIGFSALAALGYTEKVWWTSAMLPQQFVLIVSAMAAVQAIAAGQFSDGVLRPVPFLVADQGSVVLVCVVHAVCLLRLAGVLDGWTRGLSRSAR